MTDLLDELLTEQVDDRYAGLDAASVAELALLVNKADATVPGAAAGTAPDPATWGECAGWRGSAAPAELRLRLATSGGRLREAWEAST